MSADNGVYILRTAEGQHRVIHAQAIENLHWSHIHSRNERFVPTRYIEYFGNCKYTYSSEIAFKIANKIYDETIPFCEYGVVPISVNRTWKQIKKHAYWYAKQELKSLENSGGYDDYYDYSTICKLKDYISNYEQLQEKIKNSKRG